MCDLACLKLEEKVDTFFKLNLFTDVQRKNKLYPPLPSAIFGVWSIVVFEGGCTSVH
jgi:hypothetical protein